MKFIFYDQPRSTTAWIEINQNSTNHQSWFSSLFCSFQFCIFQTHLKFMVDGVWGTKIAKLKKTVKESHKNVPLVDQYQGMKQYLKSICSTVLYLRTCEPKLVKIDPKSRPGPRIKWIICRSNRDCPKGYWCPRPPGICAPLPWG